MVANAGMLDYPSLVSIVQPYAGNYANDPVFMQIVASGAKAESGWNVNSEQVPGVGSGGKGLFQFDFSGGHGTSLLQTGKISSWRDVLGLQGAQIQAANIVPEFAANYQAGLAQGLSGQNLATYVIGATERPCGWTHPAAQWGNAGCPGNASSYLNYVQAWASVTGQAGTNVVPAPGTIQVPGPTGSAPGSSIVTGPTTGTTGPQGGTTDTQPQAQIPGGVLNASGVAGQIQTGIQDAFSNLFRGFVADLASPIVLIIGSIIAIFAGVIIWNGNKVKQYGGEAATAAVVA